jgi:hypothetical protein
MTRRIFAIRDRTGVMLSLKSEVGKPEISRDMACVAVLREGLDLVLKHAIPHSYALHLFTLRHQECAAARGQKLGGADKVSAR